MKISNGYNEVTDKMTWLKDELCVHVYTCM